MTKTNLDAIDIRILAVLQERGQLSKSVLAECVNLSPSACWARLTRLKNDGYIRGYHADIAHIKIGDFVKVIVIVSLKTHHKSDFDRFEACVIKVDQIVDCISTGGGSDYVLTVISPSLSEFQTLMEDLLAKDIGIDRYFTYFATRDIKSKPVNLNSLIKSS